MQRTGHKHKATSHVSQPLLKKAKLEEKPKAATPVKSPSAETKTKTPPKSPKTGGHKGNNGLAGKPSNNKGKKRQTKVCSVNCAVTRSLSFIGPKSIYNRHEGARYVRGASV